MSLQSILAHRTREVLLNGKWIANTNFKEQITEITYQQATHRIGNLNSIALLTFHINYYLKGLIRVFDGGPLDIKDQYSFDIPEINNDKDWNELRDDFLSHAALFAQKVEQLNDDVLHGPFVNEQYGTYARNIEAVIEHSYYHLGQVVLIRKMMQIES
jgi:uncharacterized damage-inducible protein DinB